MVYVIEGKCYILAANSFREITITLSNGNHIVNLKHNGDVIEKSDDIKFEKLETEKAYEKYFKKSNRKINIEI